jgi:hypothetical protein
VSASPVLYAELPFAQHAFDVLPSIRSAMAVAAVVRFLEGVRARSPSPAGQSEVDADNSPAAVLAGPADRGRARVSDLT